MTVAAPVLAKPRCRYHVGVALVARTERMPLFFQQSLGQKQKRGYSRKVRTVWRCPINGCPCVEASAYYLDSGEPA